MLHVATLRSGSVKYVRYVVALCSGVVKTATYVVTLRSGCEVCPGAMKYAGYAVTLCFGCVNYAISGDVMLRYYEVCLLCRDVTEESQMGYHSKKGIGNNVHYERIRYGISDLNVAELILIIQHRYRSTLSLYTIKS
jgi:hypothetical protein